MTDRVYCYTSICHWKIYFYSHISSHMRRRFSKKHIKFPLNQPAVFFKPRQIWAFWVWYQYQYEGTRKIWYPICWLIIYLLIYLSIHPSIHSSLCVPQLGPNWTISAIKIWQIDILTIIFDHNMLSLLQPFCGKEMHRKKKNSNKTFFCHLQPMLMAWRTSSTTTTSKIRYSVTTPLTACEKRH